MSHNTHQQPQDTNMTTQTMSNRMLSGRSRAGGLFVLLLAALAVAPMMPAAARAEAKSTPSWRVLTVEDPTVVPAGAGKTSNYSVFIENVGGSASAGEVTVRDKVPAGMNVTRVELDDVSSACEVESNGEAVCHFANSVVSGGFVEMTVYCSDSVGVNDVLTNTASVSGGGAPPVSSETSTRSGAQGKKGPPGINELAFDATGPAGEPVQQAGGHPSLVTVSALFNNMRTPAPSAQPGGTPEAEINPVEDAKDLVFYLPLGFIGNPQIAQRCPDSLVDSGGNVPGEHSLCPPSTRVGSIIPFILDEIGLGAGSDPTNAEPLFNLAPEKGYAAEFSFQYIDVQLFMYVNVVRHDDAYMLRVTIPGVPPDAKLTGFIASIYGDLKEQAPGFERDLGAFLTNPSVCSTGPLEATLEFNTWEHPEAQIRRSTKAYSGIEDCGALRFSTALTASAASPLADAPSSYTVGLEVPQAPDVFSGLGTPPAKSVSVTMPAGTSLSPSAANGLGACQETGAEGIDIEGPESETVGADGLPRPVAGHCPQSSQVASVTASTPLLSEQLKGHLFLAAPKCGGEGQPGCTPADAQNGNLFGLYLELEAPGAGVVVKLPGKASVDPSTGQITTVFDDLPQFPVSDLTVETSGGPRAVLANPQTCGTMAATGAISPWSGTTPSQPSGRFEINEGCGAQSFTPAFTAGTTSSAAGAYSPFTLTLEREDREQDLASLSTTLPPGLLAAVSHVAQCPEPQAAQGSCAGSSSVGTATVAVGSGTQPLYQTGKVYFTGPYAGAPFGLSVVVPAVAGPFNLGDVIARVALYVNPRTAQVTAVSGPLPQIIDGVPLRIRTVSVTLNNPAFTFNSTSCAPMSIIGTAYSTQGASSALVSPYQAQGCQKLPFKPSLTASTEAATSKANGASLDVKIVSAPGQANIGKVDLTLPKILPSRDSTLNKACGESQFNENPAGCPEGSNIGFAKAITPLLNVPLTGPAYLVSHGGAAFPDVVFVLQGEGVRVDIDGQTLIKNGTTYSEFETVPDAPISSFETVLPEGPHSILGAFVPPSAHWSLCGEAGALAMATKITGQNGAVVNQTTHIAVAGCSPRITIVKHVARRGTLAVTVTTTTEGTITITGHGLETARTTVAAGTHILTVPLSAAGEAMSLRHTIARIRARLRSGSRTATTTTNARL
jgi:hypothetical protein